MLLAIYLVYWFFHFKIVAPAVQRFFLSLLLAAVFLAAKMGLDT